MQHRIFSRFWIILIFSAVYAVSSCSFFTQEHHTDQVFTLMTYNTQTFFDAVEDGSEFAAFKGSKSKWSAQKYCDRLIRLAETVQTIGETLTGKPLVPDIVVLQEIENDRVIEDFCKTLPPKNCYPYAVCAPVPDHQACTTAVLSKYPIEDFYIHSLYVEQAPSARPLVEVRINMGKKDKKQLVTVFSVHWKSKARETAAESIRRMQEKQLLQKIAVHQMTYPQIPFIVCGDFNQTLEECCGLQDMAVCWDMEAYQAAAAEGSQPHGSYYFRGRWEKIDHIFYAKKTNSSAGIELKTFILPHTAPLVKDSIPFCYNVLTGGGYSDHLPLGIQFSF